MNEKQTKSKRDQKIILAVIASLIVLLTYIYMKDDPGLGWVMIGLIYAATAIAVIFYELIDETWVAARIREYTDIVQDEPITWEREETATIDIIS